MRHCQPKERGSRKALKLERNKKVDKVTQSSKIKLKGKDAGGNKDRINRGKLKENEENKMKDYYKANEYERVADFIKEMLKGLNNKK